jgi:hypothetical protein
MTKKEIQNKIAEIDTMLEMIEKVETENNDAYRLADALFQKDLLNSLKDAGYPVTPNTGISVWGYQKPEDRQVTIQFQMGETRHGPEYTVEFQNKGVKRISASGISSSGDQVQKDLADIAAYYKMVSDVTEKLQSRYFATNMSLFFDVLENFKYPEFKRTPNKNDLAVERRSLEAQLKVLDLKIDEGRKVEYLKIGHGRWERNVWVEATIVNVTAKQIKVEDKWGTHRIIKNADIPEMIRNVQTA